ncbi:hypothetical protein EIN_186270 [Entamoeba invadens IP1]|uniref:hypothetical protein n=1 Tax=Entamoeba invadens IP1 TaxID=370355 RepID=UPI0002C3ED4A|nr:hypothetical protein EIN_186270 [Entamoeba invadens IP1]ELP94200.1 hypothetical protein EIN_186270 [Entamoeba invadens IP1]|eukprot:XP_004260971.1 hypothetical protein EIN_186270 [Entamoeba invadens IP1]
MLTIHMPLDPADSKKNGEMTPKSFRTSVSRSIGKLSDLFERSRDSIHQKFADESVSTVILGKLVQLTTEKFEFGEILSLFEEMKYILIEDENEVFTNNFRRVVWRMDDEKRLVLEAIVKKMIEFKEPAKRLMFLVFDRTHTLLPKCEEFANYIMTKCKDVFAIEGDPVYSIYDGTVAVSKDEFYNMLFDPYASESLIKTFVYTQPLFCTLEEAIQSILKNHNLIENLKKSMEVPLNFTRLVVSRAEKVIIPFVSTHSGELPLTLKNQLKTLESDIYSTEFVKEIEVLLGGAESSSLGKSVLCVIKKKVEDKQNMVVSRLDQKGTIKILSQCEEYSKLVDYNYKTLAEQLVVYDYELFKKVGYKDFLEGCESPTFKRYLDRLNKLEEFFVSKMMTKEDFAYFINVCDKCLEIRDFNMAYLLFTSIVKQSLSVQTEFEKISKNKKAKYEKIYELFSIHKNMANYRNALKLVEETSHLPIVAIFLKDFVVLNELKTIVNTKLNYLKLKNFAVAIDRMYIAKRRNFSLSSNHTAQTLLANL